jgi:hypothetical protein
VPIEGALSSKGLPFPALDQYWEVLSGTVNGWLWLWYVVGITIAAGLSQRVDINQLSIYQLYRNRLMRVYLGASNPQRCPNPFTGFDPTDDVKLHALAEKAYPGPYHIINTALNFAGGAELAWQKRKVTSFVFTPQYCGYTDEGRRQSRLRSVGYRPTKEYGGKLSLGTAMAISGAAASPNMGYPSSAPLAFLMAVFNGRPGRWLGNPRHQVTWKKSEGPPLGLFYLLLELFGHTDDKSRYVYISDGGHFENLGLYELVRRRCRFIVACDSSQDAALTFEDLGNAIRKCRMDLGIEITIDVEPIRRRGEKNRSFWSCAVGTIHYERHDVDVTPGIPVYLKPALTGTEPTDVLNYASRYPEFPHQTAANQRFDEEQFESYRRLGYHIARTTFEAAAERLSRLDQEALFVALAQRWYPPSTAVQASSAKHGAVLHSIFDHIRQDEKLKFLDAQFYPEWEKLTQQAQPPSSQLWSPGTYDELRHGFYVCNSLIQLMENVYLDLNMEQEYAHPDNRGWMNLFKRWSWSGMFRLTWAISASTYGARFQSFCERHLGLTIGDVEVRELRPKAQPKAHDVISLLHQAKQDQDLNLLEVDLIERFRGHNPSSVDKIFLLQLVVKDPIDHTKSVQFTFGFALVDQSNTLVYFRMQDHVRKMGLARQALKVLIRDHNVPHARPLDIPLSAPEVPTPAGREQCERLFKSVKYELQLR